MKKHVGKKLERRRCPGTKVRAIFGHSLPAKYCTATRSVKNLLLRCSLYYWLSSPRYTVVTALQSCLEFSLTAGNV